MEVVETKTFPNKITGDLTNPYEAYTFGTFIAKAWSNLWTEL